MYVLINYQVELKCRDHEAYPSPPQGGRYELWFLYSLLRLGLHLLGHVNMFQRQEVVESKRDRARWTSFLFSC